MAFTWKDNGKIFKGVGIYHLTWTVVNRVPILGTLEPLPMPDAEGHTAWVRATDLGRAVLAKMNEMENRHPELEIIWKQLMPDHLHAVIWMHEGFENSIKIVARGYGQGCSKIARRYAKVLSVGGTQSDCANNMNRTATVGATDAGDPYDCGNGAHTLFSTPFIRTLSHKGQFDTMVKYVKSNPDNAWMRKLHPDLFTMHKDTVVSDLRFRSMGNHWLLDWPER